MKTTQAASVTDIESLLVGFRSANSAAIPTGAPPSGARDALTNLLQGHREAVKRRRASDSADPPINLLQAAGRERDERLYCALLAWLLDPTASHCQGSAFLSALVDTLGLTTLDLDAAKVVTEVAHEESRIDIEVALPGVLLLHIEAKVDSGEGWEQSSRESRDLEAKARRLGIPAHGSAGVFLTRTGEPADSKQLRPASWASIAETLRPVLLRPSVHAKVKALAGHVLDCFAALTSGGQMGPFSPNEVDKYLLKQQADVLGLLAAWEDLENRILGQLTDKAWKAAIADEGISGKWDVYLTKGSGQPLFRRDDWYAPNDQWTCIDTGNFTLRGFLSTDPDEQAWVGLWWNKLRDVIDEKELAARAKEWMARLPGGTQGVRSDKGHGIWWPFRIPLESDPRSISDLPRIVVREWGRMALAFDEIAEMSKIARKRK